MIPAPWWFVVGLVVGLLISVLIEKRGARRERREREAIVRAHEARRERLLREFDEENPGGE